MNGGKKQTHSPSWRALMDLVQDAKYGSGDTDEEISEERWEELERSWGRGFTPEERKEVKELWDGFHQQMMNP